MFVTSTTKSRASWVKKRKNRSTALVSTFTDFTGPGCGPEKV